MAAAELKSLDEIAGVALLDNLTWADLHFLPVEAEARQADPVGPCRAAGQEAAPGSFLD